MCDIGYWILDDVSESGQHNKPFYRSVARTNRTNGGEYLIGQYLLSGYVEVIIVIGVDWTFSGQRLNVPRRGGTCENTHQI